MIRQELKSAIASSMLGKYALYVFQILSMVILARLFSPDAFGVIAAAQVISLFLQTIGSTGFVPALVYQEAVSESERNGYFSATCLLGILVSIFMVLCAPHLFSWFEFEDGIEVFYGVGITSFASLASMVPLAALMKDSRFILVSKAEILSEVIGFGLCLVALYWWNDGIAALTIRFAVIPVARFLFYYQFSRHTTVGQPYFGRKIAVIRQLFSFAHYQMGFNILNFFSRNLDSVLVAKFFGAATLGVYEKTYQVMKYPLQLFTFAITPALQPVLTKYKNDLPAVQEAYFRLALKLAVLGVFSGVMLYLRADDVVYILFGEAWMASAVLLKILALTIPVQMLMSSTGGVFQAFGAVRPLFLCGVFSSLVTVTAIVWGVYVRDVQWLCWALVIAFHLNFVQCFYSVNRNIFKGTAFHQVCLLAVVCSVGVVGALLLDQPEHTTHVSFVQSFQRLICWSLCTGFLCGVLYWGSNAYLQRMHQR